MRNYSSKTDRPVTDIRSDASANRQAIILAARNAFIERGTEVSLTDIAKEAGVSRATLYRNFPDMETIVMEVFQYNLDILEERANTIEGEKDRFFKLLEVIIEQQTDFQWLASRLSHIDESIIQRIYTIFEQPVQEAKVSGCIREDFQLTEDLPLLLMMTSGALLLHDDTEKSFRVKRALTLILEGIRK
ncbi:TetR/AcrR family transcriptional regulator [Limibacter armeniacum]|uniref:TetR/AcrR family transcriptional regulator n=1 Tax=Limibacter armeniacum TaxID=466084 RepID=UPI002FE532E7